MLKQVLNSSLFLFIITSSFSQVGINTTNPQEDLHISGVNSTARIEGLNAINNSNNHANVSGGRPAIIHVDEDGNFVIPPSPSTSEILFSAKNFLPSTVNKVTGTLGQPLEEQFYQSSSFTLTQPALITFQYSLSYSITNRDGSAAIEDGKPRILSTYIHLGDGTTADTSVKYAYESQTYTSSPSSGFITVGTMYIGNSDTVLLPAGTYSAHMYMYIGNYSGVSTTTSDAYRVSIGPFAHEYLKVVANY